MIDLAGVAATEARYDRRREARDDLVRKVAAGRVLEVDSPDRISKRLARLSAVAATPPAATTRGPVGTDVVVLERMLGTNDLIGAEFLGRGATAARSVARIVIRTQPGLVEGFGTGFLVAPGLLITNNHVLADAATAVHSEAEFDFEVGADGMLGPSAAFALEPQVFFATDVALDFTVVAVASHGGGRSLEEYGWNPLIEAEGKVILNEQLNIIQHPNGEPKQLALRENRLVDLVDDFLQYETDTAPGSSGSPVFNDQWEVVGLHHSGVPRRDDQGRVLTRTGEPWTEAMGEGAIDWVANEGVRVSRICRHLRSLALSGSQALARDQLLAAISPAEAVAAPAAASAFGAGGGASTSFTVPIEVTVRITAPATVPGPEVPTTPPVPDSDEVRAALVNLADARQAPYFVEDADNAAAAAYYAGIDPQASGETLFRALTELVTATHHTTPRYKPSLELYPDVDLQEDGQLRSVYTGEVFAPERLIVEDARTEQRRRQLRELRVTEAAPDARAQVGLETELETALPFNCEHVVPQGWFDHREPMRGDLHHLYTCQTECNNFRGSIPFFDFADFGEVVRERCGKQEPNRFEPNEGKGAVARATFYFLVRYPGLIQRIPTELEEDRLVMLLDWHNTFPVTIHERHRNARIQARQGNRNPFIDNATWPATIGLSLGLG